MPLGYLVAWLKHPFCKPECDSRQKHKDIQEWLCSPAGYETRDAARKWLLERADEFQDLVDLEKPHHPDGKFEEPIRIKR